MALRKAIGKERMAILSGAAHRAWHCRSMVTQMVINGQSRAKKDAAVQWCNHATRHAVNNGSKPWQYLLIPHDAITENMTIAGLTSACRVD
jgi:hypothetical protein